MANQGLLTVGDIVKQGCQQGGNPGLLLTPAGETVSYAVKALRSFLHHIYLNYDFPFLETEASVTVTNDYEISLSAITRYRSINALFLKHADNSASIGRLDQVDYKTLWFRLQEDLYKSPIPEGTPTHFALAPDRSKILIHPIPSVSLSGKILYYRIPDVSAYVDATTAATLDFEDSQALIKVIEQFAREWDKDINPALLSATIAEKMFGQYRVSSEDQGRAQGPIVMKLSSRFFNYGAGD